MFLVRREWHTPIARTGPRASTSPSSWNPTRQAGSSSATWASSATRPSSTLLRMSGRPPRRTRSSPRTWLSRSRAPGTHSAKSSRDTQKQWKKKRKVEIVEMGSRIDETPDVSDLGDMGHPGPTSEQQAIFVRVALCESTKEESRRRRFNSKNHP